MEGTETTERFNAFATKNTPRRTLPAMEGTETGEHAHG